MLQQVRGCALPGNCAACTSRQTTVHRLYPATLPLVTHNRCSWPGCTFRRRPCCRAWPPGQSPRRSCRSSCQGSPGRRSSPRRTAAGRGQQGKAGLFQGGHTWRQAQVAMAAELLRGGGQGHRLVVGPPLDCWPLLLDARGGTFKGLPPGPPRATSIYATLLPHRHARLLLGIKVAGVAALGLAAIDRGGAVVAALDLQAGRSAVHWHEVAGRMAVGFAVRRWLSALWLPRMLTLQAVHPPLPSEP